MNSDEFWSRVIKTETCWLWFWATTEGGYGVFREDGKNHYAHRSVLEQLGHDLTGKVVLHKCDMPCCVNPDHLVVGTHGDNVADKVAKGRQTKGEDCNLTKFPDDVVAAIKKDLLIGLSQKTIAAKYGTSTSYISKVKHGVCR